jgi:uncharacterized ferredoxin-like protein
VVGTSSLLLASGLNSLRVECAEVKVATKQSADKKFCANVAGCNATRILEPAKAAFDNVAAFICLLVVVDFRFAVGFAGDNGLDALLLEESRYRIGIIALGGEELVDAGCQEPFCQ